jgi:probable phosphoglycerate mutase
LFSHAHFLAWELPKSPKKGHSKMRLFLIRHADPWQNYNHIISGLKGCRGLTELGFTQARALEQRLRRSGEAAGCSVLLTSPLLRARQTAETIAGAFPGLALVEHTGLCEWIPGEADGMTHSETEQRFGPSFDRVAFPDRPIFPGGESWNSFNTRARAVLEELAQTYAGQSVVAVTHAGFIVVSTLQFFGAQRSAAKVFLDPTLTGITEWQVDGERWTLVRYNDALHIQSWSQLAA